jgi:Mlc titration factor MtfA (ptsG expression regulator)
MKWLERWRIRRTLRRHTVPWKLWSPLMHSAAIFRGLRAVERAHLRVLTSLFLQRKTLSGMQGLNLSSEMAVAIGAQASLLILKLDLDYYDGWSTVLVYPSAFRVTRDISDDSGVVRRQEQMLSGESWSRGPVILSWDDIEADLSSCHAGHNVVIHEFAHKLDMLNGRANGMPPLHGDMHREQWTKIFSQAFDHLQKELKHHRSGINAYGATAPAEFFAVASEYFFTDGQTLCNDYPAVYDQLVSFYRQDTAAR